MTALASIPETRQQPLLRSDTLADSVAILFALTAVQRLVGFGRSVLFCSWLDPEELGQWDTAFGFLMLAAPIAVLSLPGSFGRYVEYYRQRGQLRTFLRRTSLATTLLAGTSAFVVWRCGGWFSQLIFGRADQVDLVAVLSLTLLSVIAYNFAAELFTALRLQRVASSLEFLNSGVFAVLGIALLWFWRPSAASVVLAYGVACLLSAILASVYVWRTWGSIPPTDAPIPHTVFWAKLIPFAASVWISNWLGNLFAVVDRYMIVHFSGATSLEALALVGQYHSARVIPTLLIAVAGLLASVLLPFLSHEWEAGKRRSVSARLNLAIKLTGMGLYALAVLILAVSPWLYRAVFAGKYDGGLALLPWTLMYSVWFGMIGVGKTYLWCDERVRLVSVAFLLGLIANVLVAMMLLPRLGLLGAVLGTCFATWAALLAMYAFSWWRGMRFSTGTWVMTLLPLGLGLGAWPAAGLLALVTLGGLASGLLWSRQEKRTLSAVADRYWKLVKIRLGKAQPSLARVDGLETLYDLEA